MSGDMLQVLGKEHGHDQQGHDPVYNKVQVSMSLL